MSLRSLQERVHQHASEWQVEIQETLETPTSLLAFGMRAREPVAMKVVREPGDEWRCGDVLQALHGNGMVRVYESLPGAVLMERLNPGTPLAGMALAGEDEEATEILADVIQRMLQSQTNTSGFTSVETWTQGFDRYLSGADHPIPVELVERAQNVYRSLCGSQQHLRLLHGDLQHYNVLFDVDRGWVAIDPKGVVAEIEYELGASLRNPDESPSLFASPEIIERRVADFEASLKVNVPRVLRWAFAQGVLSAIWSVEDRHVVDDRHPGILLANAVRALVPEI